MAEEQAPTIGYDPKEAAEDLGRYTVLRKKVATLNADELKNSEDYQNILRIERKLGQLNISGAQLLELSDYIQLLANREYVIASPEYGDLREEKEVLEEKLETEVKARKNLVDKLEAATAPFAPLLPLVRILDEEIKKRRE